MAKISKVILRETAYVSLWVLILSALTQAVFLTVKAWELSVLLGNLYSATVAILNFFLMGLAVQRAAAQEEKEARQTIRASHAGRTFLLFVFAAIGVLIPFFHNVTVLLPLFFPRFAITIRPLLDKRKKGDASREE